MELSRLIGKPAGLPEDRAPVGACEDLLIDTVTGRVVYAFLSLVGGGSGSALILADRIKIVIDRGDITLAVSPEDLTVMRSPASETPLWPMDLASLPPLVVGPFGNTVAPALAAAALGAVGVTRGAPQRPDIAASAQECWHWFRDLQGLPVFELGTEYGRLRDITVDPDTWRCVGIRVRSDRNDLLDFPFGAIRNVAHQGDSIILETDPHPPYGPEAVAQKARAGNTGA